jgi:hypothetical protein
MQYFHLNAAAQIDITVPDSEALLLIREARISILTVDIATDFYNFYNFYHEVKLFLGTYLTGGYKEMSSIFSTPRI